MYFRIGYTNSGHAAIIVCNDHNDQIGYIYAAGEELVIQATNDLTWTEEGRDHKQLRLISLHARAAAAR